MGIGTLLVLLLLGGGGYGAWKYLNKPKPQVAAQTAPPKPFGEARPATYDEIDAPGLFKPQGIYVGVYAPFDILAERIGDKAHRPANSDPTIEPIRYQGDAHLITIAPSRSGKGRDVLIPALLEYQGSVIAIDPKGQLAAVTARARREMGQKVVVLNPFSILAGRLGPYSARFNPLSALNPDADSFGADADNLAEGIVYATGNDTHWHESARQLVAGLIMYFVKYGPPASRNLPAVRTLICSPYSVLASTVAEALKTGDTMICDKIARFTPDQAENKEVRGIISTAITETGFIGNTAIATSLFGSDFQFSDLKKQPMTVYLVLPTRYLSSCGKWFRLVLAAALDELLREEKGPVPVLAMMDEFAQLGRLNAISNAMALAAGYGVQLWPVLQDLTQLQELYGKGWETFLANSGVRQFFAPRDITTSEYLSQLCGDTTIYVEGKSSGNSFSQGAKLTSYSSGSSSGTSIQPQSRKLYLPLQIRQLTSDRQLLFVEGVAHVITASRRPYTRTAEFQGKYDPDPYHTPRPSNDNSPKPAPRATAIA